MKTKITSLIITMLLFCNATTAQTVTLSLDSCRKLALENNLNLKSANEKIYMAQYTFKMYRSNFFPKFSFTAGYGYSTSHLDYTLKLLSDDVINDLVSTFPFFNEYTYLFEQDFNFKTKSIFSSGIRVVQPVYMGGKIMTSTKLAKLGIEVAHLELQKTKAEVVSEADNAFFTYAKVKEMLTAAEKYKAVIDEFYRQMENANAAGMKTNNDLLKVKVHQNEAKLMILKAKNGVRLARMNLCYTTGLPLTTFDIALEEVADIDTLINANVLDVTTRPEYAMLQKNIESKELMVKLSRSDFLPSVTAMANYGYSVGLELNNDLLMNDDAFSTGVMLNIPIFAWCEGHNKMQAARNEVNIAQNMLDDLTQKMTLELMQSISRYEEAALQVTFMEEAVLQAERNMQVASDQHEVGLETIANLLEAQALWQKAMTDLIEAKSEKRMAYILYLKASGAEF